MTRAALPQKAVSAEPEAHHAKEISMNTQEFDALQDDARPGMYSLRKLHERRLADASMGGSAVQLKIIEALNATDKDGPVSKALAEALDLLDAEQAGKYDDVLRPFVALMERELHANSDKGDRPGWLTMTPEEAMLEVWYHVSKLQRAALKGAVEEVAEHAADVANMAMMVLDVRGGIAAPPPGAMRLTAAENRELATADFLDIASGEQTR